MIVSYAVDAIKITVDENGAARVKLFHKRAPAEPNWEKEIIISSLGAIFQMTFESPIILHLDHIPHTQDETS